MGYGEVIGVRPYALNGENRWVAYGFGKIGGTFHMLDFTAAGNVTVSGKSKFDLAFEGFILGDGNTRPCVTELCVAALGASQTVLEGLFFEKPTESQNQ